MVINARHKDKSTQIVKCSLCVDYAIINKELMTTDLTFSWLSLPQQWVVYKHTVTTAKVKKYWDQEPNKSKHWSPQW